MHALYIPSLCFLPISKHNPSLWSPYLTPTIICQLFLKGLASCHIGRRKIRSRSGKSDQNNRKKNGKESSGHSWIELSSEKRRRRSSWRFVQINLFQRFAQLAKMLASSSFTQNMNIAEIGPFPVSYRFVFGLFNKVERKYIQNLTNNWIRTKDLWYQKWLLYYLATATAQ